MHIDRSRAAWALRACVCNSITRNTQHASKMLISFSMASISAIYCGSLFGFEMTFIATTWPVLRVVALYTSEKPPLQAGERGVRQTAQHGVAVALRRLTYLLNSALN